MLPMLPPINGKAEPFYRLFSSCDKCSYFELSQSSSMGLCTHPSTNSHREKTHYCGFFKPNEQNKSYFQIYTGFELEP